MPKQQPTFAHLAQTFLNEYFADSPVHASTLGLTQCDDQIDDLSEAAFERRTAWAEVGRDCSWPTQASSYLTGCLEILRIRQRFLGETGLSGTDGLRQFHDTLAATGGLPIALAERAVLGGGRAIIASEPHA